MSMETFEAPPVPDPRGGGHHSSGRPLPFRDLLLGLLLAHERELQEARSTGIAGGAATGGDAGREQRRQPEGLRQSLPSSSTPDALSWLQDAAAVAKTAAQARKAAPAAAAPAARASQAREAGLRKSVDPHAPPVESQRPPPQGNNNQRTQACEAAAALNLNAVVPSAACSRPSAVTSLPSMPVSLEDWDESQDAQICYSPAVSSRVAGSAFLPPSKSTSFGFDLRSKARVDEDTAEELGMCPEAFKAKMKERRRTQATEQLRKTEAHLRVSFRRNSGSQTERSFASTLVSTYSKRKGNRQGQIQEDNLVGRTDSGINVKNFLSRIRRDLRLQAMVIDSIMGLVIVLNTAVIGMSCDLGQGWGGWIWIDSIFAVVFLTEALSKVSILGIREYFTGSDLCWNVFELSLALMAVLEVVLQLVGSTDGEGAGANFSLFRIVRLARITRIIRVCRLEIFTELMVMIKGTLGGIRTLLWSVVLISLPLYAVALIFRETLGPLKDSGFGAEAFATVPLSFFTVFRCVVSGECTEKNGRPIFVWVSTKYGWGFAFMYCVLQLFMTFGLFNVIVAIFVENVVAAAKFNDQLVKRQRLRDQVFFLEKMSELALVVAEHDENLTGRRHDCRDEQALRENLDALLAFTMDIAIDRSLFERLKMDQRFNDLLHDLDIADEDQFDIFDTLNADDSENIHFEEFMVGIGKLRGDARRSDIVAVSLVMDSFIMEFRKFQLEVTSLAQLQQSQMLELLQLPTREPSVCPLQR